MNKETILTRLQEIRLPETQMDVVEAGMVSSIVQKGSHVGFALEVDDRHDLSQAQMNQLREACEKAVLTLDGIESATVVLTAAQRPGGVRVEEKRSPKPVAPPTPKALPGVKQVIAVASGKGGVGKSTVAVNLAVALAKQGKQVGLVDADIYGPSVTRMMGLSGEPEVKDNRMIPPVAHGVKCMSMGLLIPEGQATVWRGPMVSKALTQLFRGAAWGELDVMIIDLPPGTGDVQLSIAQNFTVDAAILVSTPQEIARIDVEKAKAMFEKLNIPVLGLVENMSYFEDASGTRTRIFTRPDSTKLHEVMGLPLLVEIPITPDIAQRSDIGVPIASDQESVFDALTLALSQRERG